VIPAPILFDKNASFFKVDFRPRLTLIEGWPNPAISNSLGAITFNPDGSIFYNLFTK
jgi:hypothetical protein